MEREGELTTMKCEDGVQGYSLDIRYPDGTYHGGLSWGTPIEVYIEVFDIHTYKFIFDWVSTAVEIGFNVDGDKAWYLAGLYKPGEIPTGLTVRI